VLGALCTLCYILALGRRSKGGPVFVRGVITGYGLEVRPAMPACPVTAFIVPGIRQIGDRIVAVRTVLSRVRFL